MSDLRERLTRERNERIAASELRRFASNQNAETLGSKTNITNPKRQEELQRRYNSLLVPQGPPAPQTKKSVTEGSTIDFYCWKDGEIAITKIVCSGEPTIVT